MADISQYIDNDMTLRVMSDKLIEQSKKRPRTYLGMSEIGEQCWRQLWYRFRNVQVEPLTLKSLLAIEDGYKQEDIMADRLRLVPGVQLDTVDPETGEQFAFKFIGGHFCGHCDGIIKGILESPKTPHIWENKAVNDKKFNELKKLILEVGEKSALEKWDDVYYIQSIVYMHSMGYKRHYLTVESPGGRDYTSCRTEYNAKVAMSTLAKAETIIKAERPPVRMSENRTFYKCGWCRMKEICFDNKVPVVNCKTCAFSEPLVDDKTMNATWKCYKKNIEFIGQGKVCEEHLFLNTLVPFKTVAADAGVPNWIKYALPTGGSFCNINSKSKAKGYTSKQLYDLEYFELAMKTDDEGFKAIQKDKTEIKKLKGVI